MTRASRTTLQPLQEHLQQHVREREQRDLEAEDQHRAAVAWWDAYYFRTALERRNERA